MVSNSQGRTRFSRDNQFVLRHKKFVRLLESIFGINHPIEITHAKTFVG